MNEQDELFKKCFIKTLKKLAEEPDEVINYNEQLKKYNNVLKEKIKLEQELQRKDNEIKQLREDIVNHIKIASEYKEQMIIKDNNWDELKKYVDKLYESETYHSMGEVLDKINELEKGI